MNIQTLLCTGLALWGTTCLAAAPPPSDDSIDEITVFGQGRPIGDNHDASPVSRLTPKDLVSINAMTTEDLVKFEPDLVIRRRYIGDPNGTMGMRGSNMFQTTRVMVFADGIPLHYLLQTQYSGSPRWSLVAADEIASIDVVYGPYSAQYSGNAMGGVVNIETLIPTERRLHMEGSLFQQAFDYQGYDDSLNGNRGFISYGDRFGGLSVYSAYTHLDNHSQPMDFLFAPTSAATGDETEVSGARTGVDEYGNPVAWFGDSGSQHSVTDQLKTKIGYEFGDWLALMTVAWEQRDIAQQSATSRLRNQDGATIRDGTVSDHGLAFDVSSSDFSVGEQERRSLLVGGRVQGKLNDQWWLEASASNFRILHDESRDSNAQPLDPAYTPAGSVAAYDDTGWTTLEVQAQSDRLFDNPALSLVTGVSAARYSLGIDNFTSDDYRRGERTTATSSSGGKTSIRALYAQLGWQSGDAFDIGVGARYEWWQSADGYYYDLARNNLQDHPDRGSNRVSPKFTAGFTPNDQWRFRYSAARAYRFPIVEELYQNERRTTGASIANASLAPEDGLHQNLMLERAVDNGYLRVNLFHERIRDVIFTQTSIVDNQPVRTFLPIDEVRTSGAELVVNLNDIASQFDLRFNTAWVRSGIARNNANPDIEGKTFPRMPRWRANVLMTWHPGDRWNLGGGIRYASNSYGDLDNADTASGVFGAEDAYLLLSLKSSYNVNDRVRVNLGIDNLTNEVVFVHHPWPGRTLYLETAVTF